MNRELTRLVDEKFDIVVIGGGITGAFIAWDASRRGLKVALIEKSDFGAATSAASSKLLHGGIRYLQQAHLNKVRESAMERAHYQYMAPHNSHYIPFLVPTYKSLMKSKFVLSSAMRAYSMLCVGEKKVIKDANKYPPSISSLSLKDTLSAAPYLDRPDLTGAMVLPESHMHSSERMTLSVIKSAVAAGATVANYVKADAYLKSSATVVGVKATDQISNTSIDIQAKLTINAGGPWIPLIDESLTNSTVTSGYARGSHIVMSSIKPKYAVALATSHGADSVIDRGGRHVFIIPWRGRALIGTSYASYTDPLNNIHATEEDITQLLDAINEAAPSLNLNRSQVDYAFCGLYPLQAADIRPGVYQGTGEYQILDHEKESKVKGVISALGAKFTTARKIAELAVNLASEKLDLSLAECSTYGTRSVDGDISSVSDLVDSLTSNEVTQDRAKFLVETYGSFAGKVLTVSEKSYPTLSENQPVTLSDVKFQMEHEMAMTLDDVLFRRTGLGTVGHPGERCIEEIATYMQQHHGWSAERKANEIQCVENRLSFKSVN